MLLKEPREEKRQITGTKCPFPETLSQLFKIIALAVDSFSGKRSVCKSETQAHTFTLSINFVLLNLSCNNNRLCVFLDAVVKQKKCSPVKLLTTKFEN